MTTSVTLAQGNQVHNLILQQKTTGETVQYLIEKGYLADLFKISLNKFRNPAPTNGREEEYERERLNRARLQMALNLTPEIKIRSRHFQKINDRFQVYDDEINPKALDRKGILYLVPDGLICPWDFETVVCHKNQPKKAEFFTADFFKPALEHEEGVNRYPYDVGTMLNAAGYINADVNDLIEFADHIKDSGLECPVVAFNSRRTHSTGSGGFMYQVYPSLQYVPDHDQIIFRHIGLKDQHAWKEEYACLVRH